MIAERYKYDGQPSRPLNRIQKKYKQQLLDKLAGGEYKTEIVSVCHCGSEKLRLLAEKDRFGLSFGSVIGQRCGLILTSPRLVGDALPSFYGLEYHGLNFGETKADRNPHLTNWKQGSLIFDYVKDFLNNDGLSVVEVGCGSGAPLFSFGACCRKRGITTSLVGCEYSGSYVDYAKEKLGITVYQGGAQTLSEKGIMADVLILSHVFEHFVDLRAEMKTIRSILKEDGILYIEVPGVLDLHNKYVYDCDFLKYTSLAHMYNFCLTTLRLVLASGGFSLVKGDEYVRSVFVKSEYQDQTSLSDYERITYYLNDLEKNRDIYNRHNPNRKLHRRVMRYLYYHNVWAPPRLKLFARRLFYRE